VTESEDGSSAYLSWAGAEVISAATRHALLGPDGPFQLATEPVLGCPHTVFARRPRTLRETLNTRSADYLDLVFLCSPDRTWTFREALSHIDALAVLLAERYQVKAGDRVAIVAANSAEYALLMWATVTLGAIVTSLNGWWTGPELEAGIELTSPVLIAGDERRLARLDQDSGPALAPVTPLDGLVAEAEAYRGHAPAPPVITEDSPAVILFTSGTTGRPKGATLSHRNLINFGMVQMMSGALSAAAVPGTGTTAVAKPPPQTTSILTSPMFHISGLVGVFITGGFAHSKLVFARPGAWDPAVYLALTTEHSVTAWNGVPTQFWRILRHPELDSYDVSSVVSVGAGGATFPPQLVRDLHERFPNVRLGSGYGMSESTGLGTFTGGELFISVPDSAGPAQPTVEVQIRDERGAVLRAGEIGQIHLRTPSIFVGYWEDPSATAAVLDQDRWYATGDYGCISNGMLYLQSRRRDLILRGGENVYPVEIENRLLEHAEIDDAAVIGVDHPELGQELKAFIVRSPGAQLCSADVRDWCALALARYKVPADVEFVAALPYNAAGKLLKQELERQEHERRLNPAAAQHRPAAGR
jgi:acyl-CoA synthetase (AMP-forming)/AMP-acid ligase II